MREKDILKKIKAEVNLITPNILDEIRPQKRSKLKISIFPKLSFAFSMLGIIVLGIVILVPKGNSYDYIYLDMNPSIELKLDESQNVIDIRALNNDAALMLLDEEITSNKALDILKEIIDLANDLEYLNEEINLTFVSDDDQKEENLQNLIFNNLNSYLNERNINILLKSSFTNELKLEAKAYHTTSGKLFLAKKYQALNPNYQLSDILKKDANEIKELTLNYQQNAIEAFINSKRLEINNYCQNWIDNYQKGLAQKTSLVTINFLIERYLERNRNGIKTEISERIIQYNTIYDEDILNDVNNMQALKDEINVLITNIENNLTNYKLTLSEKIIEIKMQLKGQIE